LAPQKVRFVRRTILVVGEGLAEVALAQHIKSTYTRDGNGCAMTIRNAQGKGGRYVVDFAVRQRRQAPFNVVCALLDTDTDWDQDARALARRSGIEVVANEPCLEATLLQIHGVTSSPVTAENKRMFRDIFGGDAHEDGLISRNFTRQRLDDARASVFHLDRMMTLIGV
jgi:hypothetical protein